MGWRKYLFHASLALFTIDDITLQSGYDACFDLTNEQFANVSA